MPLTAKRLREVLRYNSRTGTFTWRADHGRKMKRGAVAGTFSHGYWQIGIDYKTYRAHRLAWLYKKGRWPPRGIDHKDQNRANNRWTNLRLATCRQNAHNGSLRSHNTSGHTGVSWKKERQCWRVRIFVGENDLFLGHFKDLAEAVSVRKQAEKKHFREFAPRG